jgi:hypothetical protein
MPRVLVSVNIETEGGYENPLVKVKVKVTLRFFYWAPRHGGVLGSGGIAPRILNLGTRWSGGEWSASLPDRFTPRERAPGTHWIGGWVGPRVVLDAVVKRKIPIPFQNKNTQSSMQWKENFAKKKISNNVNAISKHTMQHVNVYLQ